MKFQQFLVLLKDLLLFYVNIQEEMGFLGFPKTTKDHLEFAEQIKNTSILKGSSVEIDYSSDKLDKKIRAVQIESFNCIGVIGPK